MQAPYLHDRWDDQVKLEQEMLALGKERIQDKINKAKKKNDLSNLRPYRSLLTSWVLPVSEAITAFITKHSEGSRRGPKPIALPRLKELPADTAAMVALKSILRLLGQERRHIMTLAYEIGTWCEHEARCIRWMEEAPDDWHSTSRNFAQRGSNAAHQRRSRIAVFNKYVLDQVGWTGWTKLDRQRVGLELLNIIIETTRRFHIAPDPEWVPKKTSKGAFQHRPYILVADDAVLGWLTSAMDDEFLHSPAYLPTIIPPLEWEGPRGGGYYTPFAKPPFLISFKAHHEEMHQRALDEYEALDMPGVYAALNKVQNTPWKINQRVLEVANIAWENDLAIAGLPRREPEFVPPRPEGIEKGTEAYKEWAKKAGEARTRNAKRVSRILAYRRSIVLANRFKDEPEFYFPHRLDFRGRMYPIVSDLSPQGEDLHRGLLTFARGKPVNREAAAWLAVHLANTFGIDKADYDARIKWVQDRREQWLAIDRDPLGSRDLWIGRDDDDNWQRLAAVFEWVRWIKEGEGMISSLPVRVDGTCNGIQHLSSMVRDEVGGASVNLTPGNRPRDIYQEVADILTEELMGMPDAKCATGWLHLFSGKVPRSITKRPVMILPYGGTAHAYFSYTMAWLKAEDPYGAAIPLEERTEYVSFLVPLIMKAVKQKVVKAMEVMVWIKQVATETVKQQGPIWWVTPAGFYVRHFYGKENSHKIETRLDGQRIQLRASNYTKELDPAEQLRGISPNFVHSMDASALMTCVNLADANGVECFTTIHDAYGTVAADMDVLYACLREAFIETYREPILEQFRQAALSVCPEGTKMPEVPKFGSLNIEEIRNSPYFFA